MSFDPAVVRRGIRHLRKVDPVLGAHIEQAGPFRLRVERRRFVALARSIVAQQISGKAANTRPAPRFRLRTLRMRLIIARSHRGWRERSGQDERWSGEGLSEGSVSAAFCTGWAAMMIWRTV